MIEASEALKIAIGTNSDKNPTEKELEYIKEEILKAVKYGLTRTITPLLISEEVKQELLNSGYTITSISQKIFDEHYLCDIDWTNVKEEI